MPASTGSTTGWITVLRAVARKVRSSEAPALGARARMREIEFDQRGGERQHDQRVQADDRHVDAEARLAVKRRGDRHADLHGVTERRGERTHAGHGGVRQRRAPLPPALPRIDQQQHDDHRHEETGERAPRQRAEVESRRRTEQQRRHEQEEREVRQHARRIRAAAFVAEPAHAARHPAEQRGEEDGQQLVEDQAGHRGRLRRRARAS